MKIKIIDGHLTPTNKKHIKYMFAKNLLSAKINTINYNIVLIDSNIGLYKVTTINKDSYSINGISRFVSQFTVSF